MTDITKPFDEHCGALARYFLPNSPKELQDSMARDIQQAVEDWLENHEWTSQS